MIICTETEFIFSQTESAQNILWTMVQDCTNVFGWSVNRLADYWLFLKTIIHQALETPYGSISRQY